MSYCFKCNNGISPRMVADAGGWRVMRGDGQATWRHIFKNKGVMMHRSSIRGSHHRHLWQPWLECEIALCHGNVPWQCGMAMWNDNVEWHDAVCLSSDHCPSAPVSCLLGSFLQLALHLIIDRGQQQIVVISRHSNDHLIVSLLCSLQ